MAGRLFRPRTGQGYQFGPLFRVGGKDTMDIGYYWLFFGMFAALLPLYLLIKTVLHILNIGIRP
jgi:hypothetical protein